VGDAQGLAHESSPGKPVEARASYRKAVALLTDIARAAPSDARAQIDLARARNRLASAMAETGDVNAAFDMLQQTASAMESLSRKQPLDAPAKFNLGRTYFAIAEFQSITNHTGEALQARLRSIEIFRDLAAQDAHNREALSWYATSEMRLAAFYLLQLHDSAKAAASLDIAMNIDRQRVAQNPGDAIAKLDLTLGQSYMAALLQSKGDLPAAQRLYETTIGVRKELLAADPGNYRLRHLLATDYEHLGDLLRLEQNADGARRAYREGLATAMPLEPKAATDPDAARSLAELRKKAAE
jgi:tetratricopeptide (TPR) repeat protein